MRHIPAQADEGEECATAAPSIVTQWEERPLGQHHYHVEPPDLFVLTISGDVSRQEIEGIYAAMRAMRHNMYIIANIESLKSIDADARKAASNVDNRSFDEEYPMVGIALLGANWTMRTTVTLLHKAFSYFHPVSPAPVAFFQTDAEARAWVDSLRAKRGG